MLHENKFFTSIKTKVNSNHINKRNEFSSINSRKVLSTIQSNREQKNILICSSWQKSSLIKMKTHSKLVFRLCCVALLIVWWVTFDHFQNFNVETYCFHFPFCSCIAAGKDEYVFSSFKWFLCIFQMSKSVLCNRSMKIEPRDRDQLFSIQLTIF